MAKCGRPTIYHTDAERKLRNKEGQTRESRRLADERLISSAQSAFRKRRDDRIKQLEDQVGLLKNENESLLQKVAELERRQSVSYPEHIGKITRTFPPVYASYNCSRFRYTRWHIASVPAVRRRHRLAVCGILLGNITRLPVREATTSQRRITTLPFQTAKEKKTSLFSPLASVH